MNGLDAEETECRLLIEEHLQDKPSIVIAILVQSPNEICQLVILSMQSVYEVFSSFSHISLYRS